MLVCRMAAAAGAANVERLELGYENMNHFDIDTDDVAAVLMNIDFRSGSSNFDQKLVFGGV